MDQLNVFISHRVPEDTQVAHVVKKALKALSDNQIKAHVCEDIPGSAEWYAWVGRRINASDVLIFLYTDERADWLWCTLETGIFLGNSITTNPLIVSKNIESVGQTNERAPPDSDQEQLTRIVCIKNPQVKEPPKMLQRTQVFDATVEGIRNFLHEFVVKGTFTDGKLLYSKIGDPGGREFLETHVATVARMFIPPFETKYYAERVGLELARVDEGTVKPIPVEEGIVSGNDRTMQRLGLSGKEASWSTLYQKFKARGQSKWLDETRDSIEGMASNQSTPLQEIMTPFTANDGKQYIPVLSRTDTFRDTDSKTPQGGYVTRLKELFIIFVPAPPSLARDPRRIDLNTIWLPTSIVRVSWKKRSAEMGYTKEDLNGDLVVFRANREFGMLFSFDASELPDPDGPAALNVSRLLQRVEKYVDPEHLTALYEDQARVSGEIIFNNNPGVLPTVPLQFNDNHVYESCRKLAFMPRLIWRQTEGDYSGPHVTYLQISYVRYFPRLLENATP